MKATIQISFHGLRQLSPSGHVIGRVRYLDTRTRQSLVSPVFETTRRGRR